VFDASQIIGEGVSAVGAKLGIADCLGLARAAYAGFDLGFGHQRPLYDCDRTVETITYFCAESHSNKIH
jgi:hypothetical protein